MRIDNDAKMIKIKVVAMIMVLERILVTLNTVGKYGVHPYYDFYDTVGYYLMRFNEHIDIGLFSDILFLLIRKNA